MDQSPGELVRIQSAGSQASLAEAVRQIEQAAATVRCHSCGCFHGTVRAAEGAFSTAQMPPALADALRQARSRMRTMKYDCLGCEPCYPSLAANALNEMGEAIAVGCEAGPAEAAEPRPGWPPLPGNYQLGRYRAPVAVCVLTNPALVQAVSAIESREVAIVGGLHTENLGIERLVANIVSNPNIRFLVVCGEDSKQAVGHLPGQSLLALANNGMDDAGRIIGAPGKRPVLKNTSRDVVEYFRRTVDMVDLAGISDLQQIAAAISDCAQRHAGPAEGLSAAPTVTVIAGHVPVRMTPDPCGYIVIDADPMRNRLYLEHYSNEGVLDFVVEGHNAAEVYTPVVERGLISRLDHAAYIGRELARAEHALQTGEPYVQDAAPESGPQTAAHCGCAGGCGTAEL